MFSISASIADEMDFYIFRDYAPLFVDLPWIDQVLSLAFFIALGVLWRCFCR
jgi:hypothetical protein